MVGFAFGILIGLVCIVNIFSAHKRLHPAYGAAITRACVPLMLASIIILVMCVLEVLRAPAPFFTLPLWMRMTVYMGTALLAVLWGVFEVNRLKKLAERMKNLD